mmetsp:Transcript_80644/g.168151  ORF Transcript_80644/g.168151 Transcript_80644/m.168151 type:complete len:495 (-) Transcript_80644:923-2407(-)
MLTFPSRCHCHCLLLFLLLVVFQFFQLVINADKDRVRDPIGGEAVSCIHCLRETGSCSAPKFLGKPRILQGLLRCWPHSDVLLQEPLCPLSHLRPLSRHAVERRRSSFRGVRDIVDCSAALNEDATWRGGGACASWRDLVDDDLNDTYTHGEDVALGEPNAPVQGLWRNVTGRASSSGLAHCGLRQAQVDNHYLWVVVVRCPQHEIRFLEITMHHGLFMHENDALEALSEDSSPPGLVHHDTCIVRTGLQCLEVTTMVCFADHVVELIVLEDLECLRYSVASAKLHGLEFLFQLGKARETHQVLLVGFDTLLCSIFGLTEIDCALGSLADLPEVSVAGRFQGGDGQPHGLRDACFSESSVKVELDQFVYLVHRQEAGSTEIEAHVVGVDVLEEGVWDASLLYKLGFECVQLVQGQFRRSSLGGLGLGISKAFHDEGLQPFPLLICQQLLRNLEGGRVHITTLGHPWHVGTSLGAQHGVRWTSGCWGPHALRRRR